KVLLGAARAASRREVAAREVTHGRPLEEEGTEVDGDAHPLVGHGAQGLLREHRVVAAEERLPQPRNELAPFARLDPEGLCTSRDLARIAAEHRAQNGSQESFHLAESRI